MSTTYLRQGSVRASLTIALAAASALAVTPAPQPVRAAVQAAFTPGNLVVVRVGDGTTSLNSDAQPTFLDEYGPNGTFIQSIPLPTSLAGANRRLTNSGTAATEGALNLSANGMYLTLAGYDADVGTAAVAGTVSGVVNRVIARVDTNGNIDTTTVMTDGYSTNSVRSSVTDDGTQFWTGGTGNAAGIRYVPYGNTGASTSIATAPSNNRVVSIFNGQLYVSTSAGTRGVHTVGVGLPTTSGQTTAVLPGSTVSGEPQSYLLLDRDATVAGADTLYISDQLNGLLKFSFDGITWTARGSIAGTLTGLTGGVSGTTALLYGTAGTLAPNALVSFVDTAAYSETVTGTLTILATSGTNRVFRGVAFAPVAPAASAELSAAKSGPATASAGAVITYQLNIANTGSTAATTTLVTDTLPAEVSFVTYTTDFAATFNQPAPGTLVWQLGDLTAGASGLITVSGSISAGLGLGSVFTNTVTASTTATETVTTDNADTHATQIVGAILSLNKSVTPQTNVARGGAVTYTITAANAGSAAATGVTLTDTLPAEADFGGWMISATGTTVASDVIAWQGNIDAGQTLTWTFTAVVTGAYEASVVNTASLTYGASVLEDAATFTFESAPPPPPPAVINELDSDQAGTDAAEFVELYDGGAGNTPLDGLVLVFYNGANDTSYYALDLDGFSTNGAGYFVAGNLGVSGVMTTFPGNFLQNGADAVALYFGDAASFSNTLTTTINLIDAVVYDTDDADDAGLLALLNPGQPQINENAGGLAVPYSIQRCPNGAGGARNTDTYIVNLPTPGGANACNFRLTKTAPATVDPGATFTYTLTVDNLTPDALTSVVLTDALPVSVTIAAISNGGVDLGGNMVSWTIASLVGNSSVTRTVAVMAPLTPGVTLVNADYRVSANQDPAGFPGVPVQTSVAAIYRIHEIQSNRHTSPLSGTAVSRVPGIVTALRTNGFYMQDPAPDSDDATSEGIFVFTSAAPGVNVGDAVVMTGTVTEFRGTGSAAATNLLLTEITNPISAVLSTGNPLPTATVIGIGGRIPPNQVIYDSGGITVNLEFGGVLSPALNGIDFYESLEGMLVQVNDAVATGPRNSFNEVSVLPNNGANATTRTVRGGIIIYPDDFNPERVIVDDEIAMGPSMPAFVTGDRFTVTGAMDYSFGNYKLQAITLTGIVSGNLARETTTLTRTANQLSVATFNVENLDALDPQTKFDELAGLIVNNLDSPDLLGIEEIQDNDGPANNPTVDASLTFARLITAIQTAGGPTYSYRQINPVDDQDGGEGGGNIRVGFLFRTDRGLAFVDRPGGTPTAATTVLNVGGQPQLSFSPGRIDPTSPFFGSSRKPLAGEFTFQGNTLFVIANHFNSKGGDQPLFGRLQPPFLISEITRTQQALIERGFIQSILAIDPSAKVIALGDFNDFEFSNVLNILKSAPLADLIETLPKPERYTYVFDGNSQALDHILVSQGLSATTAPQYDVVHVNAEFVTRASDHDPSVAVFTLQPAASFAGSSKTASAPSVTPGSLVTYTIVVSNAGEVAAGFALTDTLDGALTLVSAPGLSVNGQTLTATGTLGAFAQQVFTITVQTSITTSGALTNTALLSGDGAMRSLTAVVNVTLPAPVAGFSTSPVSGAAPLVVSFTDTSTGTVDAWLWNFGNGVTSTAQNPTATYTLAGVYTVTLTVSGPGGSDTATRTNFITVTAGPVHGISVTANPITVTADGASSSTLTATVADQFGNPISGVNVVWLAGLGTISPASGTTGPSGQVTAQITSTEPGTASVFAVGAGKVGMATVTFTPISPAGALTGTLEAITSTTGALRKGDLITYTFSVTNTGAGTLDNVTIVASIPAGTVYVDGSANGGVPVDTLLRAFRPASPAEVAAVVWTGSLPPGGSHTVSYAVQVAIVVGTISNTVQLSVDNVVIGGPFTVVHQVEPAVKVRLPIVNLNQ